MQALPTIEALLDVSRAEVAHRAHAEAFDRIEDLGRQLRAAFDDLTKAQEQLKGMGVDCNVKFASPLDEAWASYRAKLILRT